MNGWWVLIIIGLFAIGGPVVVAFLGFGGRARDAGDAQAEEWGRRL